MMSSSAFHWLAGRKPEFWFALIGAVTGALLVCLVPPFEVPDENRHFFRAYQISEFKLMSEQGPDHTAVATIPKSVIDFAKVQGRGDFMPRQHQPYNLRLAQSYLRSPLLPAVKGEAYLGSMGVYAPLGYIPEAIGILGGRILNMPPIVLLYLARLLNLGVWLGLAYFAIRIIPYAKWQLIALLLLPMSVFEAASCSIDGVLIGASALLVSLILRNREEAKPLLHYRWLFFALSAIVAMIKPSYLLLPITILMLPACRFGGRDAKIRFGGILAAITLIPAAIWQLAQTKVSNITYGLGIATSPIAQLHSVLEHPLRLILATANTFLGTGTDGIIVSLGGSFGWLDFRLPIWAIIISFIIIYLALAGPASERLTNTRRGEQGLVGFVICATLAAIIFSLYLTYNPVGSSVLDGFQGRYLLPLLPLGLLVRKRRPVENYRALMALSLLVLTSSLLTISSFYG